ncbi:MAG: hypothetical protein WHX93_00930 [bacterium]
MRRALSKGVIIYLRQDRLLGVSWRRGRFRKVMDCSVQAPFLLQRAKASATLLIHRDSMEHKLVLLPSGPRIPFAQVMAHEAAGLLGIAAEDTAFGWRLLGKMQEDGMLRQTHLLAACNRKEIQGLAASIRRAGLEVIDVLSAVDLLVEYGVRSMGSRPGLLVVFDQELVHVIFFRDGVYGFHRVFQADQESFQEELLQEFQRSAYYAKQRYKVTVEQIRVALAPSWFVQETASMLESSLQIPCVLVPPPESLAQWPELGLLNLLAQDASLMKPLFSMIPPEVRRRRHLRRLAALSVSVELLLTGLMGVAISILHTANENDKEVLLTYARTLQVMQNTLGSRRSDLQEMERLRETVLTAKKILSSRPQLHLRLEELCYLVPEGIRLESVKWVQPLEDSPRGAGRSGVGPGGGKKAVLEIEGTVQGRGPQVRYEDFIQWLEMLKEAFPEKDLVVQGGELLQKGKFSVAIPLSWEAP